MTFLAWKPEYSVGIDSVDHEHREMIELVNALYDEMKNRRDQHSIDQFLGDIHATISAHFALEERVMRQSGYDEYEPHKDDHEELLDQIRDLMDAYADDPDTGLPLLQERLSDWFGTHFATFDSRLHGKLDIPHH
jgi:hemerythrin-like metal-binding protein